MARSREGRIQNSRVKLWMVASLMASLLLFLVIGAQAQTYKVIYNFSGQRDGGHPGGNMAIDRAGNLYGVASDYGYYSVGDIFKLAPKQGGWLLSLIYTFTASSDGAYPDGITMAPDGSLYGATYFGGDGAGCGVVFHVQPSPARPTSALQPWNESVLHTFGGSDGCGPSSTVTLDSAGNLFGTTENNGPYNGGTLYELVRSGSSYTVQVVRAFGYGGEGTYPGGTLVFDDAGNLYGTLSYGGPAPDKGSVYQETHTQSGWNLTVLTGFQGANDGSHPEDGVILDQQGNVYGTTPSEGAGNGGTAFMLTANSWTFNLLYSFPGGNAGGGGALRWGPDGDLYGATGFDGLHQQGNIFKLHPNGDGTFAYTDLYDFTGGADGGFPDSNLVFDASGNLYGLTNEGGAGVNCSYGCGVVFELTP